MNNIQDESGERAYFAMTPHIIDDLGLDPYAYRLYGHIKRVCGEHGYCNQSNTTMANACGMSRPKLIQSKQELAKTRDLLSGLSVLQIEKRKTDLGDDDTDWITMVNLWDVNMKYCLKLKEERESSRSQKTFGGKCGLPGGVNDVNQGGKPRLPKEEPLKKNLFEEEDNVSGTMPSSAKMKKPEKPGNPKHFKLKLNPKQRALHDQLVAYQPQWGKPLKSEDVCAWFLAKKYSVEQVETARRVYLQDAREAALQGRQIDNMGGLMVSVIKTGRKLRSDDEAFNRVQAESASKLHSFVEVLKRYVKIAIGGSFEEIEFNLPKSEFERQLSSKISLAQTYAL